MVIFVSIAAILVLTALAIAAWPLLRAARGTALTLLVLVPALVVALYWYKGNAAAISVPPPSQVEQVQQAQTDLEQVTAKQPDNFEAWVLLGRTRMGLQQYAQAANAFSQAHALVPDEPNVMVEYAEAQMRASTDRRFPPAAVALLERAIVGNPQNQRALFFLGMQRMQAGDFANAAAQWQKLLPLLDDKTAAALLPQINEARVNAKLPPLDLPVVVTGPTLGVIVQLDATLAKTIPPGAVLFVFARAEDGTGPPIAARRYATPAFPLSLELSDTDSVMPTHVLSSQIRVQLMARISVSGSATPGPGDIEAEPIVVEFKGGSSTTLTLKKVRP